MLDKWDGSKLCFKNSDEFAYMGSITVVRDLANSVSKGVEAIDMREYYAIKNNAIKTKIDLKEVELLLLKASKLIEDINK